ncbi:MAG TPA: type 2 isopentenyl-diphosphate Delta-isomerase [Thermoflexia bacterium]|jgi:isopentenyl-diphosphate delta-isomerase|nr:type 2 isopentenyl-diphosphate Delta-isomerase [Thermoflexia bacterium]
MRSQNEERKSEHLRISLEEDVSFHTLTAGFERYRFEHCALPELDLAAVDLSTSLLGKRLNAPLLISSMTGGTAEARDLNQRLAQAAQQAGVGMGLGSLRAALEDPSLLPTYQVRDVAPDILLLSNLGAVQLNYGYTVDHCRRAVEMVEADGLILHLNPLQEALQPEGQTDFSDLLRKIEAVCRALEVPVVVKEVGWGLSADVARRLADAGVAALDVAGAGGTSWSQVEMYRSHSDTEREVAAAFRDWGIPTAEALRQVRRAVPHLPVIASGGIRDGIQMAKAIALGAAACGIAHPFLLAAARSVEAVAEAINVVVTQLRVAMFAVGAQNLAALARVPLVEVPQPGHGSTEEER